MQRGQQLARLSGLVLLAAGLSGRPAAADTVFDFEAPGPEQAGTYLAADGAVLADGVARLVLVGSPEWAAPGARRRLELRVAADLPRTAYPVRLDLAAAPDELFLTARGDGLDLRIFETDGTELAVWLERYDWIAAEGALWFRPAALAGGTNGFHLYFGEPEHALPDDFGELFRHTAPTPALWVIDDLTPTAPLAVAALEDATRVTAGTVDATLAAGEVLTLAAGEPAVGGSIGVGGPVGAAATCDGGDAPAPAAIAAVTLAGIAPRYLDVFCLAAPFRDAEVEIRDGITPLTTVSLPAGGTQCIQADVATTNAAVLVADAPILAYHYALNPPATTAYDGYNLLPPATELLGGNTGTGYVVALEATTVRVQLSDGTVSTLTLAAGAGAALPGNGTQGGGTAVRLTADAPLAAGAYGDGDGGEAVPFFPLALLGRRFVVPLAAQYLMVAADRPGTECVLYAPDGTEVDRERGDTLAAPVPARLFFGDAVSGAPIAAGSQLVCDGPVWAVFEDGATQDEKTLWPVQLFRPVASPEPLASYGTLEARHAPGVGSVTTPVWTPAWGVHRWLGFEELGDTRVPIGTTLRYQVSIDGGTTWQVPDVGGWRAAAAGEGAEPGPIDGAIGELGTDGGIAVRALLGSDDGAEAPALDDLRVRAETVGAPAELRVGTVSSPQRVGVPFVASLTLLDAAGEPVPAFTGTATFEATAGTVTPATSTPFLNGLSSTSVSVDRVAAGVRLVARVGDVVGQSGPFDVVTGDVAGLELVSGDGQFGPAGQALPQPLRVRVVDPGGNPISGIAVAFAVTRGGGTVAPSSALSDGEGIASATWTVNAGANLAEASLSGHDDLEPVEFAARGDTDGPPDGGEDDGCGCRTTTSSGSGALPLLGLFVALLLRRPRGSSG
ncbi:MAG: Ig-like domain-containing protein [Deltaproteobacteria bacterium]|nr:Ig-like domain-containing protein [Deltaproteobacteria bacterium]